MCCTASGSPTWHRPRSGPRCSTRASTCARSRRCTGCCARTARPGDRRRQATHPAKVKPELVATAPNQVWSWDITKLHGPAKWTYYYLYVILDIFSRYVGRLDGRQPRVRGPGRGADRRDLAKQSIDRDQLTIHADRGSSMTSKPVAFLLADLGVTKSHSRPHVLERQPLLRGAVQDAEVPVGEVGPILQGLELRLADTGCRWRRAGGSATG